MDRKLKKALIRERNKRTQVVQYHKDQHQQAREDALEAQEAMLQQQAEQSRADADAPGNEVWSAQTQMIRNRITNKRRKSMDKWNRFAGTAGAGGMGR